MSNTPQTVSVSIAPTSTLLGLLFIALKLTGYINWSWFYVTLPFWAPFAIFIGLVVLFVAGALILAFCSTLYDSIKYRKKGQR